MKPLVVIPTYLTKGAHLEALQDTLGSILATEREDAPDILVVDDGSPDASLVEAVKKLQGGSLEKDLPPFAFVGKEENTGFSATVNVGLEMARSEARDAVLLNADVELDTPGWVKRCQDSNADLLGALLVFPQSGLIQHAGIQFSFLTRRFYERFKFAPPNLPEALVPKELPCTGAFQYIKAGTLENVGLYDERFKLGYEDVDYCIRVFQESGSCVYDPDIRAYHFESMVRGDKNDKVMRWEIRSWRKFVDKWGDKGFGQYVPEVL